MVYKCFYKKSSGSSIQNEIKQNEQLAEELHKPIIKKICRYAIGKFNKEFRFLLCVIDIYSKYAWAIPLKDNKGITITNGFQKVFR